jgi:hypothetical protein
VLPLRRSQGDRPQAHGVELILHPKVDRVDRNEEEDRGGGSASRLDAARFLHADEGERAGAEERPASLVLLSDTLRH